MDWGGGMRDVWRKKKEKNIEKENDKYNQWFDEKIWEEIK